MLLNLISFFLSVSKLARQSYYHVFSKPSTSISMCDAKIDHRMCFTDVQSVFPNKAKIDKNMTFMKIEVK